MSRWLKRPNFLSAKQSKNCGALKLKKTKMTRLDEKTDDLDKEIQRLRAERRRIERDQQEKNAAISFFFTNGASDDGFQSAVVRLLVFSF